MEKEKTLAQRIQLILSLVLRLGLVAGVVNAVWIEAWLTAALAAFALCLTFLPALFSRNYRILLPIEFEFFFVVFIFGSTFLGAAHGFYEKYWWWDVILHGVSGITLGLVGFILLFILHSREKIRASARMIAFFSFCFAVAFGALWEIFEFIVDIAGNMQTMQPSLKDTMWDLIMDASGALLMSYIGYLYMRYDKENFAKTWLEKFIRKNPRLFKAWRKKA